MSTRTRLGSVVLAAIAGLAVAGAHPAAAPADTWSLAATPHFQVYAAGSPKRATDVLRWLERMRGFFADYLKLEPTAGPPIRVVVFDGDRRFEEYRPSEAASAFFQTSAERNYMVLRDFNGDAGPTVTHEYTHAALSESGALLPLWLSEGLAEFFSTVTIEGRKATIGHAPPDRQAALAKRLATPVSDLFEVTRASAAYNQAPAAGLFYADAWALTHMLMVDAKYKDRATDLIHALSLGEDSRRAFADIYGKSAADVDKDLRSYVQKGFFRFFWYDYRAPADEAMGEAQPVDAYEAELVLAQVLAAQTGREREAAAALDALARERPGDVRVLETRTEMALRRARNADTDALVARAIAAGSRSPQILIDAARQIQLTEPERALASLPPLDGLSVPLKFEYFQVVANAEAARMNFDKAAEAAAGVARSARTPREIDFARALARAIENPPDADVVVEGRLRNVECRADAAPVLEVQTAKGTLRLVVDDPAKVIVAGKDGPGAALNLGCEAQDTSVKVGYAAAGAPPGADGRLRFLDFRKRE